MSRKLSAGFATLGLALVLLLMTASAALAFTDVPRNDSDHYGNAIYFLYERGVVSGRPDGTFGPNEPVLRAQVAKTLAEVFDIPVDESMTSTFTDLGPDDPNSLYPHDYVAAAQELGIVKGLSSTRFGPYQHVRRSQAVTLVVRAFDALQPDMLIHPDDPDWFWMTADEGFAWEAPLRNTGHWEPSIVAVVNGLLWAMPCWTFDGYAKDPWLAMPRKELAQVLYNSLVVLGEAPGEGEPE